MTLPVPVPLDPPPGSPAALDELVSAVTGAAFRTGVLAAHLAGPAASAPGWLGDDAAAAAGEIGAVTGLVQQLHGTLTTAEQRLRVHAGVLADARQRIAALRREQEEDFAAVSARAVALADPDAITPAVDDLVAAEARRRREHAALVAEVTTDATAAARVLAGTTTGLGGGGSPGRSDHVRAHLAALLPGWGEGEMVTRAWAAARDLDGPVSAEGIDAIAREGLAYAGNTAYAGALLANLGTDGVGWLLTVLGQERAPSGVLARWLATAFGAARPPESGLGPLPEVLTARYVDPDDPDAVPDQIVFGLAALLGAVPATAGGVRSGTAAAWGAQMLARERRQGIAAAAFRPTAPDPVEMVVDRLAAAADPGAAAVLLADREAWDALLARRWDDGAAAIGTLVEDAAAAPGPAGDVAIHAGLAALGNGLSPEGPGPWTVDRDTAAQLAPSLGRAVAAHVGVAAGVLGAAGTGHPLALRDDEVLRGLGYLTLDPGATAEVQRAVDAQTAAAPHDPGAVVVRSALVAVREYGQRLDHALDAVAVLTAAVDRQFTYDVTIRFGMCLVDLVAGRSPAGEIATALLGAGVDGLASLLGADGSWEVPPDHGLVLGREDAAAAASSLAPDADPATAERIAAQARAVFDRTTGVLGVPRVPGPAGEVWEGPLPDIDLMELIRRIAENGVPAHR